MTRKIYRNGDYVFCEGSKPEGMSGEIINHAGSFTFAVGGATSHTHAIHVEDPKNLLIEKLGNGSYFINLYAEGKVTHPEHSEKVDLAISPGEYLLFQKQEKDHFSGAIRKIID